MIVRVLFFNIIPSALPDLFSRMTMTMTSTVIMTAAAATTTASTPPRATVADDDDIASFVPAQTVREGNRVKNNTNHHQWMW